MDVYVLHVFASRNVHDIRYLDIQKATHKLALLNHFNRGRQPASWNWCPAHPVGFSLAHQQTAPCVPHAYQIDTP